MDMILKIVLIIAGILVVTSIYNSGWEAFKESPTSHAIGSGKMLIQTVTGKIGTTPTANFGKPFCRTDDQCNQAFAECGGNCSCLDDGTCGK